MQFTVYASTVGVVLRTVLVGVDDMLDEVIYRVTVSSAGSWVDAVNSRDGIVEWVVRPILRVVVEGCAGAVAEAGAAREAARGTEDDVCH